MWNPLREADAVLRNRGGVPAPDTEPGPGTARLAGGELPRLLGMIALFGVVYGGAMGAYTFTVDPSAATPPLQVLFSAIKTPLLLLATFALSLPTFFVLMTLLGLREDLGHAVRSLLAAQAALTVVLASCAPLALLLYASTDNYDAVVLFHAAMFALASVAAQLLLRRLYRPLIARHRRHRTMLRVWLVIYAFVGIQMGWVLRPFIGAPDSPTTFFRAGAWGNAYLEVWQKVAELVT